MTKGTGKKLFFFDLSLGEGDFLLLLTLFTVTPPEVHPPGAFVSNHEPFNPAFVGLFLLVIADPDKK